LSAHLEGAAHPAVQGTPARSSTGVLTLAALGIVFGDIGTSPLYAFKEAFAGPHALPLSETNVLGVLSLLFWTLMLVVSLKYVVIVLRFDNRGEGGVLALLAYAGRLTRERPRTRYTVAIIAIVAASLFYGDAVITPAISVLSAVEGISVVTPALERWVIPVTLAILVALFAIQRRGTGGVGRLFGPVTVLWFGALLALGLASIAETPGVVAALDPRYAIAFAAASPASAFIVLGAVFLAVTGAEALYADMGHFGATPVRLGWFGLVFPSLVVNYFGQGALVLRDPTAVANPFFLLAPELVLVPLVALATAATVIASQATISGAFSVTQQASRLGYLPRIPVTHTSESERGQIYIGRVNWLMLVIVVLLVLGFQSSSNLAAAYGIAVSGTMLLTTALIVIVVLTVRGAKGAPLVAVLAVIGLAEALFVASNATKILAGGWFPLVCGLALFTLLTTWKTGTAVIHAEQRRSRVLLADLLPQLADVHHVPGTAIYLSADPAAAPTTLLHVLKHFKVAHERMLFVTIENENVPRVPDRERTEVRVLEPGRRYQVTLRYGFMENPDVPRALHLLERHGIRLSTLDTTFFLGKTSIAPAARRGAFTWRRALFRAMQRNAPSAAEYLGLPANRVVELGTRVSL
jgi:KUP system potassium uptake protein